MHVVSYVYRYVTLYLQSGVGRSSSVAGSSCALCYELLVRRIGLIFWFPWFVLFFLDWRFSSSAIDANAHHAAHFVGTQTHITTMKHINVRRRRRSA